MVTLPLLFYLNNGDSYEVALRGLGDKADAR